MKDDKFLIGIVVGIVVLVLAALVAVLVRTPESEAYIADDTPAGVVHNYFLAVQRKDFEKAHSYLSDDLKSKPDLDDFIQQIDYLGNGSETALRIRETRPGDGRTQVDVSITTYRPGNLFDSGSSTTDYTAYLRAADDGEWKLVGFPYPYWGYDWDQEQED